MNFMCVCKSNNAKLVTSIIGKVSKKSTPKSKSATILHKINTIWISLATHKI